MAKLAKRGRKQAPRGKRDTTALQSRRPIQIALERVRQGCYGICAGAIAAIPAAMMGEHLPSRLMVVAMGAVGLFAGATGVLVEVLENRIFPGESNGS